MSIARVKCCVLLDFDGTISKVDTTDLLLERFAAPAWRDIEEEWKAAASARANAWCADRSGARHAGGDGRLYRHGGDHPGFRAFVDRFPGFGHTLMVISDSLDRAIRTVLDRADINLPYFANHLQWLGGDRWRLTFRKRACAGT